MDQNNTNKPQFIGIGAARSGSTWAFNQLVDDERIWIPRIKELHYFSRNLDQCGPSYLHDPTFLKRLFGNRAHNREFRKKLYRAIGSNILKPSLEKFRWDTRYWLGNIDDDWYLSLFEPANGRLTGEITPAYSGLDDRGVAHIAQLLPQTKVIHFLRDPVDRAWSLVRYHQKRENQAYTELDTDALLERAKHPFILAQSDYAAVLERWEKYFSKEQLLVRFYDEITEEPANLLANIYQHLELSAITATDEDKLKKRVNPSFDKSMPEKFRDELCSYYLPMLEQLAGQRGGYFERWQKQYKEFI